MIWMLARRRMLRSVDLKVPPSLDETAEMLKPGIPLAFCIGALMTTVVAATNIASGVPLDSQLICTHAEFIGFKNVAACQHQPC